MTTQHRLWGYADTRTSQARLFEDGPRESTLTCQCGEHMIRTPGGFLSCPLGHGKLHEQANDPAHWDGDTDDLFTTED